MVLLLDYDGTLAPFHPDRFQARPYPQVAELLQAIIDAGRTRLVIISGRALADLHPTILHAAPAGTGWTAVLMELPG